MASKRTDPTSTENPGDYSDLPVRPAGGGYGATDQDIIRGYSTIPNIDTDGRTGQDRSRVPTIPAVRE